MIKGQQMNFFSVSHSNVFFADVVFILPQPIHSFDNGLSSINCSLWTVIEIKLEDKLKV